MLSFFLSFLFLYRKTLGGFKMRSHSGRRVSLYRRERSLHDVVKQANILVQNLELGGEGRGLVALRLPKFRENNHYWKKNAANV